MDKTKARKVKFILGLTLTGIILLMMIAGIVHTPYDPMAMDPSSKLAGVSWKHIMGCDNFGRDIFSRVLVGVRETMFVAAAVVFIGTVTGYFGGWVDEILMRFNDAVLAFPSVLLALLVIGIMGGGTEALIIALGIAFVPSFARI
ncbi:MAG: ABC transporter permease, partial [Lachnospiraceae bacterium]|nr:ABC transporter permease [Lachnospiraceae bacterium]